MAQATASLPDFRRSEGVKLFYAAWIRDPFRTGAIAPSSRWLARLMTRGIRPGTAPILELGPGTGVFTDKLIRLGVPQKQITLVEYDRQFAGFLQRRFPQARVLCMNAARLGSLNLFDGERASAAISGLPLLALSYREVLSVMEGAFAQLRPTAALYQFTYGTRCPVPQPILVRLGLKATLVGRTLANLPPARVYRIRHRGIRAWGPAQTRFGPIRSESGVFSS